MKLKLVEPFKEMFKDEVRILGKQLGIDKKILLRHPFQDLVWQFEFPVKLMKKNQNITIRRLNFN